MSIARALLSTSVGMAALMATAADAQNVIVMRQVITAAQKKTQAPAGYYSWKAGAWNEPALQCGQTGTSTRTVSCMRTDGAVVEDALCTGNGAGTKPTSTGTYQGMCGSTGGGSGGGGSTGGGSTGGGSTGGGSTGGGSTGGGSTGGGSTGGGSTGGGSTGGGSTGGGTTPTPTPAPTPTAPTGPSTPATTYSWTVGDFSPPSTTCGQATQTRPVLCMGSDGQQAAASACGAGMPSATRTSTQTSGCTTSWQTGDWSQGAPTCGSAAQTRTVTCMRSDGSAVGDEECAGAKPAAGREVQDLRACTYDWSVGLYSTPSSTCGDAVQTRPVYCQRSDGTKVQDASCTEAKPETQQTSYQTTGCTYAWSAGTYGEPAPACGASTRTRGVTCRRSDGQTATDDRCDAGTRPASTGAADSFATCGYEWSVSAWHGSAQCGNTVTQTRDVTCQRSDGQTVTDSFCAARTAKPASTQPITDYSGCSYSWRSTPGVWSSSCSTTATRPNEIACRRSDGVDVAASLCDPATKPPETSTGNLSGCTYAGTYEPSSTCTGATGPDAGTQQATVSKCTRSDGATVSNSQCSPQTRSQSCTVEVTSTQYAREAFILKDPFAVPNAPGGIYRNTSSSASSMNLMVTGTQCWDMVNNKASATATCSELTRGPNVYDISSIPATFVDGLKEIYVDSAQLQAMAPHGSSFFSGNSVSTICANGAALQVGTAAGSLSWTVRCGTPDTPDHYDRQAYLIRDGSGLNVSRYLNASPEASDLKLVSTSTFCWDTTGKKQAADRKCQYLPSGVNTGDVLSLPATYVADLREVYVPSVAALQALSPNTTNFLGATAPTICASGTSVAIGPKAGSTVNYTLLCGTPDTPDHYERQAFVVRDGYTTSPTQYLNPSASATDLKLVSTSTLCWDKTAKATAGSRKCQYLPTGVNVGDVLTVPATYVPELREVYVPSVAALQAIAPNNNSFLSYGSANSACTSGNTIVVGTSGATTDYVMRCGPADNASHYERQAATVRDGAAISNPRYLNTSAAAEDLKLIGTTTNCWDTATNSAASSTRKCDYLARGVNVGDVLTLPATYVPDLREVYVPSVAALQAVAPNANFLAYGSASNACTAANSITIGSSTSNVIYRMRCGTPDTADHYVRYASSLGDPYSYATTTDTKRSNSTGTPRFYVYTRVTACYDTKTGAAASDTRKCDYLGSGGTVGDIKSVPATWNTTDKIVTINRSDLAALYPYTTNYNSSVCGASFYVYYGYGGTYTIQCK
jgi:hypothetical protein